MADALTALSDWLHKLPAEQLRALRQFRAEARAAYPGDANPIEHAIADGLASPSIVAMPREFVAALDH